MDYLHDWYSESGKICSRNRATQDKRPRSIFCCHGIVEDNDKLDLGIGGILMSSLPKPLYKTRFGETFVGDALDLLKCLQNESVDLVLTSPPFALQRQKVMWNRTNM